MKITKRQLRRLIREEFRRVVLRESITAPGTTPDLDGEWSEKDEARSKILQQFAEKVEAAVAALNPGEGQPGHKDSWDDIEFSSDGIAGGLLIVRFYSSGRRAHSIPIDVVKKSATQVANSMGYKIRFTDQTQHRASADGGKGSTEGALYVHLEK